MDSNIYKAPESQLSDNEAIDAQFYVVSKRKFFLLFFATLGMYSLYWFYKQWAHVRFYSGRKIWPIPRAIFSIFFTHSLFKEKAEQLKGVSNERWDYGGTAGAYVLLAIISHVLSQLVSMSIGAPYVDILSVLILFPMSLPIWRAQRMANLVSQDELGSQNTKITAANTVFIILGVILWTLSVVSFLEMNGVINLDQVFEDIFVWYYS